MDENKDPIKKRLSEQLPSHAPDGGSWQRISAKLDALDADDAYRAKLEQLPLHSPDQGTWPAILSRLNRAAYFKTGIRTALAVAAGLVLLFTISRTIELQNKTSVKPGIAKTEHPAKKIETDTKSAISPSSDQVTVPGNPLTHNRLKEAEYATAIENAVPFVEAFLSEQYLTEGLQGEIVFLLPDEIYPDMEIPVEVIAFAENRQANTVYAETQKSIMFEEKSSVAEPEPAKKYYTPDDLKKGFKNTFGLGMNYLPENMFNGSENTVFHNVDLTASYNKEKIHFKTSVGMAYNEDRFDFDINYDINTPVTAMRPGGKVDTIGYDVMAGLESEYQGFEKHQYFIYNLGIDRKLFSLGKFSTWISAGAGFGIRLNDPDLVASTKKVLTQVTNASIVEVTTTRPEYNDVNINFVTGLDFNYEILQHLSITFTPTSRWYFKPVLTKANQATDELTLGFKTGMRFEF